MSGAWPKGTYAGLNHTHLTELLEEREGIDLSRSTVRRILLSGGIKSPRKRRAPKHHSRRVRYPQESMETRKSRFPLRKISPQYRAFRFVRRTYPSIQGYIPLRPKTSTSNFNRRFGVCAAQQGSAYRQLSADLSLDSVLCFKYLRTVANDNTVRFNSTTLQLLPDAHRASYARATVEVQERLDGSLVVVHADKTIGSQPAPSSPVTLRARNGRRATGTINTEGPIDAALDPVGFPTGSRKQASVPPATPKTKRSNKPGPDHPWRRKLLT